MKSIYIRVHRAAKERLQGLGGSRLGYSEGPFRKAFLRGRCMNRNAKERGPGDGGQGGGIRGQGNGLCKDPGAQCARSHRRTHMVGGRKLTDEARRNQQPS